MLLLSVRITGQNFEYKAGFHGFFDNREYFNEYVNDQTIFGSRIYGELGYSQGYGKIMAGINYLYEFGTGNTWNAPDLTAYYSWSKGKYGLTMGAFPRLNRVAMPLALMNDTVSYYRPNIQGLYLEYKKNGFQHNVWIDWTGKQSMTQQEMFHIGFSGTLQKGIFLYQHHFIMTHLAHSLNEGIVEHIQDNAGFIIMPGLNLTRLTRLDTLTFSAGIMASYDRLRGVYGFDFPIGFYAEIEALYKHVGLKTVVYTGESQSIISGDGFYKANRYIRADAYYAVSNDFINTRLQWSFHFVPGVFDMSMSLVLRAEIEKLFGNHHDN
jgi:hypothetical protein